MPAPAPCASTRQARAVGGRSQRPETLPPPSSRSRSMATFLAVMPTLRARLPANPGFRSHAMNDAMSLSQRADALEAKMARELDYIVIKSRLHMLADGDTGRPP